MQIDKIENKYITLMFTKNKKKNICKKPPILNIGRTFRNNGFIT